MVNKYVFISIIFVLWILGFYLATGFAGEDFVNALTQINPLALLGGIGTYILAISIGMFVLFWSLKKGGIKKTPGLGVAKAWLFGSFIDNVFPTITPIGEASMAYFLERFYKLSYNKSLAAIAIYVSAWGLSVCIFATSALILAQIFIGLDPVMLVLAALMVTVFIVMTSAWIIVLLKRTWSQRLIRWGFRTLSSVRNHLKKNKTSYPQTVVDLEFGKAYDSLTPLIGDKKPLFGMSLLFIVNQLCHALCIMTLCWGFGADISLLDAVYVHVISSVLGLLMIIPSGLGVYEITGSGLLATLGVPPSIGVSVIFIYRLIFVWGTNLMGGLIGITQGIDPGQMKKVAEKRELTP